MVSASVSGASVDSWVLRARGIMAMSLMEWEFEIGIGEVISRRTMIAILGSCLVFQ